MHQTLNWPSFLSAIFTLPSGRVDLWEVLQKERGPEPYEGEQGRRQEITGRYLYNKGGLKNKNKYV